MFDIIYMNKGTSHGYQLGGMHFKYKLTVLYLLLVKD